MKIKYQVFWREDQHIEDADGLSTDFTAMIPACDKWGAELDLFDTKKEAEKYLEDEFKGIKSLFVAIIMEVYTR